jgi:hypothetical protein
MTELTLLVIMSAIALLLLLLTLWLLSGMVSQEELEALSKRLELKLSSCMSSLHHQATIPKQSDQSSVAKVIPVRLGFTDCRYGKRLEGNTRWLLQDDFEILRAFLNQFPAWSRDIIWKDILTCINEKRSYIRVTVDELSARLDLYEEIQEEL